MSRGNHSWAEDVGTAYTDARYRVGTRRTQHVTEVLGAALFPAGVGGLTTGPATEGEREWVFARSTDGAAAFAQGEVAIRETGAGADEWVAIRSDATVDAGRVIGVAQYAVADDSWGWVLRCGYGEVEGDGAVTADTSIVSAAAGRATNLGTANEEAVFGFSFEADGAAGSLFTARIDLP